MKTYPGRDRAKDVHKLAGAWIARVIGLRYTDRTPEEKRSVIQDYCERLLEDVPRYVRRRWKAVTP